MTSDKTAPDWAAIADAYAHGRVPVAQICAQFGVTPSALYHRARRQGWPKRRAATPKQRTDNDMHTRGAEKSASRRSGRDQMIARLYEALDRKMSEFETAISERRDSAAESERDARTLNTLVRLFERLCELEEKTRAKAKSATTASADQSAQEPLGSDADQLRQELARRLEHLCAEGKA